MKSLLVLDAKNYNGDMLEIKQYTVRGMIVENGKIAMQQGEDGTYKIPGGGIEQGETNEDALIREVREEIGLVVKRASITPIGEIEEMREDIFEKGKKYHRYSYFYICEVEKELVESEMTESEKQRGYHLSWATPQAIYEINRKLIKDPSDIRDTEFMKLIVEGKLTLK